MERETIERQLANVEASIKSAERAAEEQNAKGAEPTSKQSDMLVELLIARLLRVGHRNYLLRELSRHFVERWGGLDQQLF